MDLQLDWPSVYNIQLQGGLVSFFTMLEGVTDLLKCKIVTSLKNTIDYHDEVEGELFEKWILEQLLMNLKKGSIIVMDNVLYHSDALQNCQLQDGSVSYTHLDVYKRQV